MGYRGNSLKLRAKKGLGFGRALPSAFGFDNGYNPNGSEIIEINDPKNLLNATGYSIEFWMKKSDFASINTIMCQINSSNAIELMLSREDKLLRSLFGGSFNTLSDFFKDTGVLTHVVLTKTSILSIFFECYVNGVKISDLRSPVSTDVAKFFIGYRQGVGQAFRGKLDEFRVYNRVLTKEEILLNYNSGVGNNPFQTELLNCWCKFEEFETLDFSALQDNSDLRLGLRDYSGKNRHGKITNMTTDSSSPNYPLKPF